MYRVMLARGPALRAKKDSTATVTIDYETVAGTGELGLDPTDDRLATETALKRPFAIEFDREGNLYISDTINSRIVRVAN